MLHILFPSMTRTFRSACFPRQWLELYATARHPFHLMQLIKVIGALDMYGGLLQLCGQWFNEAMHVLDSKKTLEVGLCSWSYHWWRLEASSCKAQLSCPAYQHLCLSFRQPRVLPCQSS